MPDYRGSSADPYLYGGTDVLINLAGIRNDIALQRFETMASVARAIELAGSPVSTSFDVKHLQAIHRHIFQNVYAWAGKFRSGDIAKGNSRFASHTFIESYLQQVFKRLNKERTHWNESTDFPAKLAEYLGEINAVHPFREGNGRTARAFISQLADEYGFEIQWGKMTPAENLEASIASFTGNDLPLTALIRAHLAQK